MKVAGMLCPVCRVDLVMSERQGVEIDYCPQCRGVWLDRGELDKILERSAQDAPVAAAPTPAPSPTPTPPPQQPASPWGAQPPGYNTGGYPPSGGYAPPPPPPGHYGQHGYYQKRKKSFLEELFD